ncbi:MAG TPA: nuclear transport factor 2 family protein [Candidatus Polarisedimenticolia bacterium]|nr:nuclear transport factor 2 family protein [Candidatus Polarisedimenticolia bacterium]
MRNDTENPMTTEATVLLAEDRFFAALSNGDQEELAGVLADDCVLIDVMTGSEVPRSDFVGLVGSGRLVFASIERLDARVRLYGGTAIVTGQTRMIGRFDALSFRVRSRYTHVYAQDLDAFRLVNAQGTPVAPDVPQS